jgi:hypothetical protein
VQLFSLAVNYFANLHNFAVVLSDTVSVLRIARITTKLHVVVPAPYLPLLPWTIFRQMRGQMG